MDTAIVAVLALALGFLLGAGLASLRSIRREARRRAALGMSAGLARFLPAAVPVRSAEDVLAGRIRLLLAGTEFTIPVLSRSASRVWREELDARFAALTGALEAAGNDTGAILRLLLAETDALLDALIAYDTTGVLPEREALDALATDAEILRATLEVWRAANPLAATLIEADETPTSGTPSEPSNGPLPSGAGPRMTSSTA